MALINPLVEIDGDELIIEAMLETRADGQSSTVAVLALYPPQPPAIVAIEHIHIWSV